MAVFCTEPGCDPTREFKHQGALNLHKRNKHEKAETPPPAEPAPPSPPTDPDDPPMTDEFAVPGYLKVKRLNVIGRSRERHNNKRSRKFVRPDCQVPVVSRGDTVYTTGPCQSAVKDNPELAFSWFKTCTHGPEKDGAGREIPPHLRPYYEGELHTQHVPVIGADGVVTETETVKRWVVQLRVTETAIAEVAMSGDGARYWKARGARDVSEWGMDPFCEAYGCYRQDVRKFKNGTFCTPAHAKFVKARETGTVIPLGSEMDGGWPRPTSSQKRKEVLASIDV